MPVISEAYRDLNRQLHAENPNFGRDHFGWSRYARDLIEGNGYGAVLDYGCGKGELKRKLADLSGVEIREYDPAIEGKEAAPKPAELVVCTDVLEHIEPQNLNAVLRDLRRVTQRRLFATIFLKASGKTLADGRNAHLIQKPGAWWREKLLEHFQVLAWEERGAVVACELVAKGHTGKIKPRGRRRFTPEMRAFLGDIRSKINASSDAFSQVGELRMWEGVGDEPADLTAACDILEHLDDIDAALADLARCSQKCAFVGAKTTPLVTAWDWRRALEKRFRFATWQEIEGRVMMIGAPAISVQGVTAVGAVASDDRWSHVEAACSRVSDRIRLSDPHGRTAVVACYGPSLIDTIDQLRELAGRDDVDLISVSGAHDFLIERGIVPDYHVECDPRPHKALNLERSHGGVIYLIASVCHQDYFDRLGEADIRLWHVSTQDHVLRLIHDLGEDPKHVISGGGSVGLRSIPLLYAMGYRAMSFFGMDCSFADDGEAQWAGKHAGKRQDVVDVDCGGRIFKSSPVLLTYATNFFETVQKVSDLDVRLYGDGLLQGMTRYYQDQGAAAQAVAAE